MHRLLFFAAAIAVLFSGSEFVGTANSGEPTWKVGAAKITITPDEPLWMAGYGGRNKPSEGKLTDLWAKALVLEDANGQRGVVLTLDLVGIDRTLSETVCNSLQKAYGLSREQITICCSHTHTGPVVGLNLAPLHYLAISPPQQQAVDAWVEKLQTKMVTAVGEAIDKLEPSQLSWGSGTATFAVNRRENVPEATVPQSRVAGTLKGPSDHDVPVLAARNAEGKLTAVLFGYACHATVLSFNQWSGDYPGFAQMALEENHPDCVALFFAGCGADQNPLPRRTVELAQHYGQRLANAVDAVLLTSQMQPVAGTLTTALKEIDLPLAELPNREEIQRNAESSNKYEVSRAKMLLKQIDGGTPLSPTYPYPVGVWSIGDAVQFVSLGGEVVVDYANRLKFELGGTQTWVAGYANDVMAYIPSRRVLAEGGYEGGGSMVYYGLPAHWAPEIENNIVNEVHRQVKAAKN
ncbi:Neutral ceramidase precursor [Novipirellula galeiformis]|uniref:Neutral ceramidase n=1 Tax=Novipirellula galeiformis TaxID=2528004 RepID=A0A5C6CFW3_9BACT|nr:neutral/alkaline non-lysosomal ceramidase N-terminal domain-containing protein [Novipirellula galeiformis]TWU22945.1 Neutral ceramidase precursor [Novipirellula galeiformis]